MQYRKGRKQRRIKDSKQISDYYISVIGIKMKISKREITITKK